MRTLLLLEITDSGVELVDLTREEDDGLPVRLHNFKKRPDDPPSQRDLVLQALRFFGVNVEQSIQVERGPFRRLVDFLRNLVRKSHD